MTWRSAVRRTSNSTHRQPSAFALRNPASVFSGAHAAAPRWPITGGKTLSPRTSPRSNPGPARVRWRISGREPCPRPLVGTPVEPGGPAAPGGATLAGRAGPSRPARDIVRLPPLPAAPHAPGAPGAGRRGLPGLLIDLAHAQLDFFA